MIAYPITAIALEAAIEAHAKGWLAKAKKRTAGFRKKKAYSEKSSIWSQIKEVYMQLQGGSKCAYCERKLADPTYGKGEQDVEHFRPKKNVRAWKLPAALAGKGVKLTAPPGKGGYYLLPYHPFNYTASCKPCNSALKGDQFPIAGKYTYSGSDPAKLKKEKPYLIYPIGDIDADPETLIAFNGLSPATVHAAGFEHQRALVTIEFFKLDDLSGRKDLFIDRARVIMAMHPQLLNLASADAATRARAQGLVAAFTRPMAPHANCARSFQRLFAADPASADALFQAASNYLISNS
jgi:hypothetical protein